MILKRQIEEFTASLPGTMFFTYENLQVHAAEKTANQFIFLHIIIHQNTLFLNQFAIPLSPGGRPPRDMPKTFLSDAGRAAVEAAHHISILIDRATAYPLTVPFAGYCAYSASTVHIWGIFSKNAQLEARSKENLRHTYRYLNKMKKYWGMFHYMVESAKDRYRQFADAAIRGAVVAQGGDQVAPMFQYGDWFDKYPHGVSRFHWEDPDPKFKEKGDDAVMGQKPDLQSVEDFFSSLSPTPQPAIPRKSHSRKSSRGDSSTIQPSPRQLMVDLRMAEAPGLLGASGTGLPQPSLYPQTRPSPFGQSPFDLAIPADQLPQIDRQFVYGSFGDFDTTPFVPSTNSPIPPAEPHAPQNQDSAAFFSSHMDPSAPAGVGEFHQPSAWFLPFNLDPVGPAGFDPNPQSQNPAPGGGPDMSEFGNPANMVNPYDLGLAGMNRGAQ